MGRFTVVFTLVVTITMINAYNLVDGLDGLAGSMALIALICVALVAGTTNVFGATALVAAASIVGYLIFNFPTSWNRSLRSFMGDGGSTLLGLTVVWVTLGVAQGDARIISPVHCLWFAALPIFDCLACFVKRVRRGKSPFESGRDHAHHMLRRGGFRVRETVLILAGIQLVYASVGVAGHFAGVPDVAMFTAWSVVGILHRIIIHTIAKYHRSYRLTETQRLRLGELNETSGTN
jgi:UDP-GlcNAc:undecaprenyl-phosphate GlcNAc-1-phosphate transferase